MLKTVKAGVFQVFDPQITKGSLVDPSTKTTSFGNALDPQLMNSSVAQNICESAEYTTSYTHGANANYVCGVKLDASENEDNVFVSMVGSLRIMASEGIDPGKMTITPILGYLEDNGTLVNYVTVVGKEGAPNYSTVQQQVLLADVQSGGVDQTKNLFCGFKVSVAASSISPVSIECDMNARYNYKDITSVSGLS